MEVPWSSDQLLCEESRDIKWRLGPKGSLMSGLHMPSKAFEEDASVFIFNWPAVYYNMKCHS